MLKIIKRYIVVNRNFFIILLVNFFAFYSIGELYDIRYCRGQLEGFLYEYMFFLNVLMILKYRKALKESVVMIIFLLLSINYFLIDSLFTALNFNAILGIIYIYILISNYKETDDSKFQDRYLIIFFFLVLSFFLECINVIVMMGYVTFLNKNNGLSNILVMLIPYVCMFLITVIVISRLRDIKRELKATIISLSITILVCLILSLMDIENIIIMITLFSVLYLFIRDKMRIIKINKKIIIVYLSILVGVCGYKYIERGDEEWLKIIENYGEGYSSLEKSKKTGICYKKIGFKNLVCGKIIKGKKEGKWNGWYEDGRKKSEGTYLNGKREGKWIEWYKNGEKKKEGVYKGGAREGKWIEWYENGNIQFEENYRNGKVEGKWIEYYKNGKKELERTYENSEEIERIAYDENGNRIE